MHPDLAQLQAEASANLAHAGQFANLSPAQFNWRPEPGRPDSKQWSIAECFAHLNIVNGSDLPRLEAIIRDARQRNVTHPGPYRYAWLYRWFVKSQEPPVTRKFKAPKYYQPPPGADPIQTLDEYRRNAATLIDLIPQADGLDLARVRIPFLNMQWLKMPLGARLALINSHDRRHLWQADQVRAHPSFPK